MMRAGYFSIMQTFPWAFKQEQLLDVLIGKSWSINKKGATGELRRDALRPQTGWATASAGISLEHEAIKGWGYINVM